MSAAFTPTLEMKLCNFCGQEKPLSQFRREKGGRDHRRAQCRECFAEYMRGFRRRHRNRLLGGFASQLTSPRCSDGIVEKLCAVMVHKMGGLDEFTRIWWGAIEEAGKENPGSQFVLRSLAAMARLVEIGSRSQPDPVSQLSDEDLESEMQSLLESVGRHRSR